MNYKAPFRLRQSSEVDLRHGATVRQRRVCRRRQSLRVAGRLLPHGGGGTWPGARASRRGERRRCGRGRAVRGVLRRRACAFQARDREQSAQRPLGQPVQRCAHVSTCGDVSAGAARGDRRTGACDAARRSRAARADHPRSALARRACRVCRCRPGRDLRARRPDRRCIRDLRRGSDFAPTIGPCANAAHPKRSPISCSPRPAPHRSRRSCGTPGSPRSTAESPTTCRSTRGGMRPAARSSCSHAGTAGCRHTNRESTRNRRSPCRYRVGTTRIPRACRPRTTSGGEMASASCASRRATPAGTGLG